VPALPLTGGCLCGGVRFEVTEPPQAAGYCHCTRCQRRTGTAAAISTMVPPGAVRVTAGEDLVETYWPEDGFGKAFCRRCGSALWSVSSENPEQLAPRMGAYDEDPGVRPAWRQFVASAAPWEPIPDDGLRRFEGRRTA
jgi:hypothetical protein